MPPKFSYALKDVANFYGIFEKPLSKKATSTTSSSSNLSFQQHFASGNQSLIVPNEKKSALTLYGENSRAIMQGAPQYVRPANRSTSSHIKCEERPPIPKNVMSQRQAKISDSLSMKASRNHPRVNISSAGGNYVPLHRKIRSDLVGIYSTAQRKRPLRLLKKKGDEKGRNVVSNCAERRSKTSSDNATLVFDVK